MQVTFRISRFNPERDRAPHLEDYMVEMEPDDRVLDGLHKIKWEMDGTLTLRRSCAHGICGSDAMQINGKNRLACKVLIKDVAPVITVEPMRGFRVLKDMIVDMEPFFAKYRAILPYLINDEPESKREQLQSPKDRERYDDTTKCILCGACTSSCPSYWATSEYLGPAAIVQAHRFIYDSRDRGAKERLEILNRTSGVWRCRTIFNCVDACPRGIQITKAIGQIKKALAFGFKGPTK